MKLGFGLILIFYVQMASADCSGFHMRSYFLQKVKSVIDAGYEVTLRKNEIQIKAADSPFRGSARAELDPAGNLSMEIYSRKNDVHYNEAFTGRMFFDLVMFYFEGRVKSVMGNWISGTDNLADFNHALYYLWSPELAARSTWTGRQAARYGFSVARVLDYDISASDGITGVTVRFSQP